MAVQKPESKWWTYFVIFLLVFLIAVIAWRAREAYFSFIEGEGKNEDGKNEGGKTYCTAQSREGDVCASIYQPVCGWFDPGKVQCITAPCATTYGNSCEACHNEDVEYWVEGECLISA